MKKISFRFILTIFLSLGIFNIVVVMWMLRKQEQAYGRLFPLVTTLVGATSLFILLKSKKRWFTSRIILFSLLLILFAIIALLSLYVWLTACPSSIWPGGLPIPEPLNIKGFSWPRLQWNWLGLCFEIR